MEKVKIISKNPTGSGKYPGELCLSTGIIKYDPDHEGVVEYSHIMAENMDGYSVYSVSEVKAPEVTPEPEKEPVKEEVKIETPKEEEKPKTEKPRASTVKHPKPKKP